MSRKGLIVFTSGNWRPETGRGILVLIIPRDGCGTQSKERFLCALTHLESDFKYDFKYVAASESTYED